MALRVVAEQEEEQAAPRNDAITFRERLDAAYAVVSLVQELQKEADQRVTQRSILERRWLEDLLQYHGQYDQITQKELKDAGKSQLFINQTRPKTDALEARLWDLLFPVDDRNYGIRPTPVPELSKGAKLTVNRREAAIKAANEQAQGGNPELAQQVVEEANELIEATKRAQAEMDEATARAEAMEEEIADQLVECGYPSECREVIHEACLLGTGVLKGPIITGKAQKSWKRGEPDPKTSPAKRPFTLQDTQTRKPGYTWTDVWSFFPDMRARKIEDSESNFERHLYTDKQLRALAKVEGFNKDAIRRLLTSGAKHMTPTYLTDLRTITGAAADAGLAMSMFHVWEYHGPVTGQQLKDIAINFERADMLDAYQDVDPLLELNIVMWFCQEEVLFFAEHVLDSAETVYSVFTLCRDPGSIYGIGVPRMMADSQKAHAAAWRMMMDNSGLSSGPQIVIDEAVIEPLDYDWGLRGRKMWRRKPGSPAGRPAIETIEIESHQAELANIIELSKQFIDDETAVPQISQGEMGTMPTNTPAQGMAMMLNQANIVVKRIVKNFDDQVTVPSIRRIYHWNMQFSEKEYIKGDYCVDARGSSVLVVREIQAQNLLIFALTFAGHPVFGVYVKPGPTAKAIANANMLTASEILYTEEEVKANLAKNPPQEDPRVALSRVEHENRMKQLEVEHKFKMEELTVQRDIAMATAAHKGNVDLEKEGTKLLDKREERETKERLFAGEAALTNLEKSKGGGGSL